MYQTFDLKEAPLSSFYAPCIAAAVYVAATLLHAAANPPGVGEVKTLRGKIPAAMLVRKARKIDRTVPKMQLCII